MSCPVSSELGHPWFEDFFAGFVVAELEMASFFSGDTESYVGTLGDNGFCIADFAAPTFLLLREECVSFVERSVDFLCVVGAQGLTASSAGEAFSFCRNGFENSFFDAKFGKNGLLLSEVAWLFPPSRYTFDDFSRSLVRELF